MTKPRRGACPGMAALAVGLGLAFGAEAADDVAPPATKAPPHLVVTLDGGLPAENLVRILTTLADEKVPVRMRTVALGPTAGLCDVLAQAKFPPPCGTYRAYLEALNPRVRLFAPGPDTAIVLPDLTIDMRPVQRLYTRSADTEDRLKTLVKNWSQLNAKITDSRPSELDVAYDRYTVELFPEASADATRAARTVAGLRLKNTGVDVRGAPNAIKLFSDPGADAKSDCEASDALQRLRNSTRKYLNWFDIDLDAARIPPAPATERVQVHILDTPVELSMPNLDPQFAADRATIRCTWAYDRSRHHGNHLAGIIASKENGTGFSGVEPSVDLRSFSIIESSVDQVAEYIEDNGASPPPIVLVAAGFPIEHLVAPSEDWEILQLPDRDTRFQSGLTKVVNRRQAFLVVAAGERRRPEQPIELSAITNLFPQNLGDLPNVVVVAACDPCGRGKAELLKNMYRTDGQPKFVHVAAPGGKPIPGWTSETSMHAVAGTSQAAAYVAGVAAAMMARYPRVYGEIGALKYRLQMCSYPLPTMTRDLTVNRDTHGLGVGVVDPAVCLLDPNRTWIKQAGTWKPVRMKGWKRETAFMRATREIVVAASAVFRVVRTPENRAPDEKLALYVDRSDGIDAQSEIDQGLGLINLVRGKGAAANAGIVLCDGDTDDRNNPEIPLAQIDDLIVASQRDDCR